MVHYDHGNGVSIADVDGDGLYDVYFTTQVGPNVLWRNRCDGSFEKMTDYAGIGLEDAISVAPSFADIDNDGDPDLYVTTVRFGPLFGRRLLRLRPRRIARSPLYFGLGDDDSVASVTVDWPSGRKQTVRPVRSMTNELLEIVEPSP